MIEVRRNLKFESQAGNENSWEDITVTSRRMMEGLLCAMMVLARGGE